MRWTGWWWVPATALAFGFACTQEKVADDLEPVHTRPDIQVIGDGGDPDDGDAGTPDAGQPDAGQPTTDAGTDGGQGDGGTPPADGGTDGGTDAGTPPITLPNATGWQFYGPQDGLPQAVWSASRDGDGNLWVAGGKDGLFVLTPGATTFKKFTAVDGLQDCSEMKLKETCEVIAVTGGPGSTVYVGYHGAGDESESDPMWMQVSGDADKVVFNGATLTITHYDISSPPGLYSEYPGGREKMRRVRRILLDEKTGNVWFGGNHGVAMWEAKSKMVWEHQHAGINGYKQSASVDPGGASYTMLSGDWPAIGLDGKGDLWMGGGHRVAKIAYASEGGQFWGTVAPIIDVWPDQVPDHGRPEERVDDLVEDMIVDADGSLWVGSLNGLARIPAQGTSFFVPANKMADPKVTALERDPQDGSVWVGHLWGGLTRIKSGTYSHYSQQAFGSPLVDFIVRDIQSDERSGQREILVAFSGGAVGIYTGP